MSEELVSVNKYSSKIQELPFYKRVNIEYPLLVRDLVARKLANVAEKLPSGLYLQIDSAYRSKETQKILWESRNKELGEKARELVYDPNQGTPPHTTGGAVDVSLVDSTGKEINLSEPYKKYYDEPQLVSSKITQKSQEYRNLLNSLMIKEGFVPNLSEYWHFSYGDKSWSEYTNEPVLYHEVDLESKHYYGINRRFINKVIRKCWKVVNKLFGIQTNY